MVSSTTTGARKATRRFLSRLLESGTKASQIPSGLIAPHSLVVTKFEGRKNQDRLPDHERAIAREEEEEEEEALQAYHL